MGKSFESWQEIGLTGTVVIHPDRLELIVTDGIRVSGGLPYFPVIKMFVPPTARRGDLLTITGEGFGTVQKLSVITLGGLPMRVEFWSENTIRARVPLKANTGRITLITEHGTVSSETALKIEID